MKTYDSGEFRELLGKVCDESQSDAETARLNEILKSDEIAREECMDHLFLSGMLEREYSGKAPEVVRHTSTDAVAQSSSPLQLSRMTTTPSTWQAQSRELAKKWGPLFVLAAVFVVVISGSISIYREIRNENEVVSIHLFDSSFELSPSQLDNAPVLNKWFGDGAEIVGEHDGIEPLIGREMLHFVTAELSSPHGSDVYQIIDLIKWRATLEDGNASAIATVNFNADFDEKQHGECLFGINLYSYSDGIQDLSDFDPENGMQPLAHVSRNVQVDSDAESWQDVSTTLELPTDSRYLVVQLSAGDANGKLGNRIQEYFADGVSVSLVSSK